MTAVSTLVLDRIAALEQECRDRECTEQDVRARLADAENTLADLRGKVRTLPDLTEGPERAGTARWSERDRDIYSLAIEEAQAALDGTS